MYHESIHSPLRMTFLLELEWVGSYDPDVGAETQAWPMARLIHTSPISFRQLIKAPDSWGQGHPT